MSGKYNKLFINFLVFVSASLIAHGIFFKNLYTGLLGYLLLIISASCFFFKEKLIIEHKTENLQENSAKLFNTDSKFYIKFLVFVSASLIAHGIFFKNLYTGLLGYLSLIISVLFYINLPNSSMSTYGKKIKETSDLVLENNSQKTYSSYPKTGIRLKLINNQKNIFNPSVSAFYWKYLFIKERRASNFWTINYILDRNKLFNNYMNFDSNIMSYINENCITLHRDNSNNYYIDKCINFYIDSFLTKECILHLSTIPKNSNLSDVYYQCAVIYKESCFENSILWENFENYDHRRIHSIACWVKKNIRNKTLENLDEHQIAEDITTEITRTHALEVQS